MSIGSAFHKRVKRQVMAREQVFFAACAPGLENLLAREMKTLGFSGAKALEGGVEFSCRVHDMYRACLYSSLANRVVMRVDAFRAAGFEQLSSRLERIAWELYLPTAAPLNIRVSARQSRLYHTGAIREKAREAIRRRMGEQKENPEHGVQDIFIRADQDRFLVSIDAAGQLLYKRGIIGKGARAPLRATLAAALLSLGGYDGTRPLADPLCGSGTFSLEAALVLKSIPPGWHREFAFMQWPGFAPGRWKHLRDQARALVCRVPAPRIFASDIDLVACQWLGEAIKDHGLDDAIDVAQRDFLSVPPHGMGREKGLVVLNPPYGRRLGQGKKAGEFFKKICRRLEDAYKGWDAALVVPKRNWLGHLPISPFGKWLVPHGGKKVILIAGKVR